MIDAAKWDNNRIKSENDSFMGWGRAGQDKDGDAFLDYERRGFDFEFRGVLLRKHLAISITFCFFMQP